MSLKLNLFALIALLITSFVSGRSWVKSGRIIGGRAIEIEEAPYQALVLALIRGEKIGICGASIITKHFVLTAAHCTSEAPSANVISVQVGTKYFDRKGMHVNVVENIIHPNYSDKTLDCDIAILKLETNLQFGKSIKAIPLINSNETIEDGVMCTVSGWGFSNDGGDKTQLRAVDIPKYNHAKCNKDYKAYGGITDGMMCAGIDQGGKDSCRGDSGGPLACFSKAQNGKVLHGIVSWGNGCAKAGFPGVYTNTQAYIDWIRSIVKI